ncbi:hypothetical protein SCUCBS95973_008382 [Sporothrix curviconia]|uniref:C6 zinc finger domain containing protein n=1 Tax=Sporothrix curviconia TaxID=1260050 RepID=A0ABP0CL49_9PEZI
MRSREDWTPAPIVPRSDPRPVVQSEAASDAQTLPARAQQQTLPALDLGLVSGPHTLDAQTLSLVTGDINLTTHGCYDLSIPLYAHLLDSDINDNDTNNPGASLDSYESLLGTGAIVGAGTGAGTDAVAEDLLRVPGWDSSCSTWLDREGVDFPVSSPLSLCSLPVPCSITLTPLEGQALDHYSNAFSVSFTMKHPKWSTLSMLRLLGQCSPMVMHFLLAVALNDLWWRNGAGDSELHTAAQRHYRQGAMLLTEVMDGSNRDKLTGGVISNGHIGGSSVENIEQGRRANLDATTQTHIMAAFWFLYLYRSKTAAINVNFLTQLSETVTGHIIKYKLDELCSVGSNSAAAINNADDHSLLTQSNCSARDGSLIAMMITCLYYQDIKHGFYHCGGRLAQHLNADKMRLGRIYDMGRNALALNWGSEYPVAELVDDMENYAMLKFNSELNILLEDMHREFTHTHYDPVAEHRFRQELNAFEIRYSRVFETSRGVLSESSVNTVVSTPSAASLHTTQVRSRLAINADLCTAYFYAVRVYQFRCTLQDSAVESPAEVKEALSAILHIARRILAPEYAMKSSSGDEEHPLFHRIEWPLFIAGSETNDLFYQDWTLQKLGKTNTKTVLEQVLHAQRQLRHRVGVEFMRRVFVQGG